MNVYIFSLTGQLQKFFASFSWTIVIKLYFAKNKVLNSEFFAKEQQPLVLCIKYVTIFVFYLNCLIILYIKNRRLIITIHDAFYKPEEISLHVDNR